MFGWLAKRTKAYKDIKENRDGYKDEVKTLITLLDAQQEVNNMQQEEIAALSSEVERLRSGGVFIEEGNSSVTFSIDTELQVTVASRINKELTNTLIDNNYITSAQSEDETAINFAFILIANEATEQVIEDVNNYQES